MVQDTYGAFAHGAIAPLVQLWAQRWVMELFRGPTLAFKDFCAAVTRAFAGLRPRETSEKEW